MKHEKPTIMLTTDVEDWFQVENFKKWIPFSTWSERELRVENNINRLLDLFDSIDLNNSENSINPRISDHPKTTFFILGWIAERNPRLVRKIQRRGHEIASHGYNHELCNRLDKNLKNDIADSKNLLEDITGMPIYGYRAPNFSVNNDILKIIRDCGYVYDSSYNSFQLNKRYGKINLSGCERRGISYKLSKNFYEIPISNLNLSIINAKFSLPWGGGGYFRLIPFFLFRIGIRIICRTDSAYLFFIHPWEIDPKQPRMGMASSIYKFRHYTNLSNTDVKLRHLMKSFDNCDFKTCHQYICSDMGSI